MDKIKKQACDAIDARKDEFIALGEKILRQPELGYKENKTSELMKKTLAELGVQKIKPCAKTGLKGWLHGNSSNASVALLGELDAVKSPLHPFADLQTGAAHACGHNAQLAVLAACAVGLSAVQKELDGSVCFMCAPAEEYGEIEYRSELKQKGEIDWLGGKQQMLAEGTFDDVDMAMMVHAQTDVQGAHVVTGSTSAGFVGKSVRFIGKEAHAGASPWEGVNALNAATLAMQAIHANRESFKDDDHVRVHPIITKGGDIVNTVPADVQMESYVRAASLEAMKAANKTVNRAIKGAAYAIGAQVDIQDMAGYLPLEQNLALGELFAKNAKLLMPNAVVADGLPFGGSTDMGDVSWVLPAIQPTVSGFMGAAHSCNYAVADPLLAYIVPAKLLSMTVIDLLRNGAAKACEVKRQGGRKSAAQHKALWQGLLGEQGDNLPLG